MTKLDHRFLGIDIGATKIAAGVVDVSDVVVLKRLQVETRAETGGPAVLHECVRLAEELADGQLFEGIGIAVCELVDRDGRVRSAQTFDWRDVDVAGAFAHVGPASVDSDVRVAARAEAAAGGGRGLASFLYINAGSGISSSLVLGGVPLTGARGNAIVIGGGPLNVENVSGGVGMARVAGVRSTADLVTAATTGEDRRALEILEGGGRALGEAIAFAVNLLDPEAVILGGGVVLGCDAYRLALVRAARQHIWSEETRLLGINSAELGSDAGLIGAALTAASLTSGDLSVT